MAERSDEAEALDLLRALVRAVSPNPPGDESAPAEVARGYLEAISGVSVEDVGIAPERPMLVATLDGAGAGRTLLLGGHLDTVPAGDGWSRDPFGAEVEGGRLYGRGAADMKSGIAGILVALRLLAAERAGWKGRIVTQLVPDEEPGGQLGAQLLLDSGRIAGDAAIIAEPSELRVYRAQKGNIFVAFTFRGRAAHGAMPWNGVNAISAATRFVRTVEDELGPALAARAHPLLGPASVSVGTILGGVRTNVVPDECVVTLDRRVLPGESAAAAVDQMRELAGPEVEVRLEHVGAAFETPDDHWLVREAQAAVAEVRGPRAVGGLVGSSDARFYAAGAGIPTILLGPGSMSQAHAPDEWVDLELLARSVEVYHRLARRILDLPRAAV